MALTDYKISRQVVNADGSVTALLRIYEGDITTELEPDIRDVLIPVTRYRRTRLLRELEITTRRGFNPLLELNSELAKDTTRTAITEQVNP